METTRDRIFELDHRSGNGIDVGLYWHRSTDRTYLVAADEQTGDCFRIDVAASRARDAFVHPFAYRSDYDRLFSSAPAEWIGSAHAA
jgi:hypothetical protein